MRDMQGPPEGTGPMTGRQKGIGGFISNLVKKKEEPKEKRDIEIEGVARHRLSPKDYKRIVKEENKEIKKRNNNAKS